MSKLTPSAVLQGLVLLLLVAVPAVAATNPPLAGTQGLRTGRVAESYGRLPLSFEANQGQTDARVKFLSRGSGYTLFLTSTEVVLALSGPQGADGAAVRMKLVGANAATRITGLEELRGKVNYFIGNDRSKWRTNVPTYAKVRYENVYPGVDLVYYGNQHQLEYDFVVAPGADPAAITLAFEGTRSIEHEATGHLILRTTRGDLRMEKPFVYQEVNGVKKGIAAAFVLDPGSTVGTSRSVSFRVAAYDRSKPLVIDPVLSYSTYLGGSGADNGFRIAVDAAGNAYMTGGTSSSNFATTAGAFDPAVGGGSDVFVAKLDPTGSVLVYSTYLGGSGSDSGGGIAVDAAGHAYVTGITDSTNFPAPGGGIAPKLGAGPRGAGNDVFVTKLDPAGSALVYSTYLGGGGSERANGIAVDAAGHAYVVGRTMSADFPTTAGAFDTTFNAGTTPQDAFVAKLDAQGAALLYSTFLGGNGNDEGVGMALDAAGHVYVTGFTNSNNFPTTAGAFQTAFGGPFNDAFMTKIDPSQSGTASLLYSTYIVGGSGAAIAADSGGNAYVTGSAAPPFPTTAGAFSTAGPGVFVTKIDPAQSGMASLVYSTYLGSGQGNGIAVDAAGHVFVTGITFSTSFPTTPDAFQSTHGGGVGFLLADAFVSKVDPSQSGIAALVYSTYFGGNGFDEGRGIAVDSAGNAYVVGSTTSTNFPGPGGIAPKFGSGAKGAGQDAFVAKFSFNQPPVANAGADQTVTADGTCLAPVTLNGTGSADPNGDTLTFTWTGSFGTASGAAPTVSLPLGTHAITLTVDDGNGETASDTVVITVVDSTGPVINVLTVTPGALWPPNHKMVPVTVAAAATDNCSGSVICRIVSVGSNEPIDGLGDGDTAPDWDITSELGVSLRAERSGKGSGRIYTITVQCTDPAGTSTTKTVTVTAAHDHAKKK